MRNAALQDSKYYAIIIHTRNKYIKVKGKTYVYIYYGFICRESK